MYQPLFVPACKFTNPWQAHLGVGGLAVFLEEWLTEWHVAKVCEKDLSKKVMMCGVARSYLVASGVQTGTKSDWYP